MVAVPKDEFADAIAAAERYGYDGEGVFTVKYVEYPPLRGGAAPIIADVEVVHTPSGIARTYSANSGTSWPAAFACDVEAGVFGVVIGQRRVRPWSALQWVRVSSTPDGKTYRVVPEDGQQFGVAACTDAELLDGVVKELRRRDPQGQ